MDWKVVEVSSLSLSFSHFPSLSLIIYRPTCRSINVWSWQRQKRSNSARHPQFLNLTTSETKQFCETSFKNGKLSAELKASYHCVLRFFQSTCLNYCACHEKVMPGHTKCCTCHAKSSQQTWRSHMLQNATPLGKSAPGPPNSSDEDVSCTAPAAVLTFEKVHNPLPLPRKTTSEPPKSGANMWCFVHFDFEMCFAPQRRALFRYRNFQKWSGPGAFRTFWLRNVLRATTACTFSTSQLQKVLQSEVFCIHFDIEMCFAPQRRALFRHLNFQKCSGPGVFCRFWFRNVFRATTACTF